MTTQAQDLADRYAAVWNEADPAARRAQIQALWARSGEHYVGTREATGYEALEQRVIGAYENNIKGTDKLFRARQNAQLLRDVVTFNWEMVRVPTGEVLAVGLEFMQLDEAGKIVTDHQFIVS